VESPSSAASGGSGELDLGGSAMRMDTGRDVGAGAAKTGSLPSCASPVMLGALRSRSLSMLIVALRSLSMLMVDGDMSGLAERGVGLAGRGMTAGG
jgi:hypothetical protein